MRQSRNSDLRLRRAGTERNIFGSTKLLIIKRLLYTGTKTVLVTSTTAF